MSINEGNVKEESDKDYGMIRTEIICARMMHIWGMYLMADQSQPACTTASILFRDKRTRIRNATNEYATKIDYST
jgi:peptide methionine sulfoxide reductase MsrB